MFASNPTRSCVETDISDPASFPRITRIRQKRLMPGLALCFVTTLLLAIGPVVWGHSAIDQDASQRLLTPSLDHPLGTDRYGRDLLARVLVGGRWTLLGSAFVALGISAIAMTIGAISSICGQRFDLILGRLVDAMLAIPSLVIALALTSILGPSFNNLAIALIITGWPWYARSYRIIFLQAWHASFVESSVACGATRRRIFFRHIIPVAIGPIAVLVSINFGFAILNLTSLSFLGLGLQPPTPEWGSMINDARPYFQKAPLQMVAPGVAIAISVLAINLAGNEIRDRFDPMISKMPATRDLS